jgi:hypothetical protein
VRFVGCDKPVTTLDTLLELSPTTHTFSTGRDVMLFHFTVALFIF